MKNLFLTCLAAFALAGTAFAESSTIRLGSALGDRGQTVALASTVAATTTNTTQVGSAVDLREWKNVALQVAFTGLSTNSGNVTLTFLRTGDRLGPAGTFETTPKFTWVLATSTTGTVVGVTNLPNDSFSGVTALKLESILTGSNGITNLAVAVSRKR